MRITAHQPNYLPYLGFFEKIGRSDLFVIVDNVQYVGGGPFGWQNRNRIRTQNGWEWLTVPVVTAAHFGQKISEVQIDYQHPWRRKHWKSIEQNYKKAPFFQAHKLFFQSLFEGEPKLMSEFNEAIIRYILEVFRLPVKVVKTSELGVEGDSTDRIIDICRKVGADSFIFGMHGRDYADTAALDRAGIQYEFQEFQHPTYKQQFARGPEEFIPHLAAIDLLFNHGEESHDILLGKKQLLGISIAGSLLGALATPALAIPEISSATDILKTSSPRISGNQIVVSAEFNDVSHADFYNQLKGKLTLTKEIDPTLDVGVRVPIERTWNGVTSTSLGDVVVRAKLRASDNVALQIAGQLGTGNRGLGVSTGTHDFAIQLIIGNKWKKISWTSIWTYCRTGFGRTLFAGRVAALTPVWDRLQLGLTITGRPLMDHVGTAAGAPQILPIYEIGGGLMSEWDPHTKIQAGVDLGFYGSLFILATEYIQFSRSF